jgi:hypothetical protein
VSIVPFKQMPTQFQVDRRVLMMLQPPRVHFRRLRRLFPSLTTVSRLCRNSHAGYVRSTTPLGCVYVVCTSTSSRREAWWTHCANFSLAPQTEQTSIYPSTVMRFPDAMRLQSVSPT